MPQVDTREHDLGNVGAFGFAHLAQDRLDGNRALGTTCLPHDTVGATVVAAVLDLDAQARAAQKVT